MKTRPSQRSTAAFTVGAFTMVEMLISSTLLLAIFGGLGLATSRALALFETATTTNDIESRAGRACDRLARELIGASARGLAPALDSPPGGPVVWSASVEHRLADRWEDGAVVWGGRRRIAWEREPGELDNGADDDGDGLVDEGMVVSTELDAPERRVVLVHGVAELLQGEQANGVDDNGNGMIDERGLCFALGDGALDVHLTLETRGPRGEIQRRTQEVSVWPRNTDS